MLIQKCKCCSQKVKMRKKRIFIRIDKKTKISVIIKHQPLGAFRNCKVEKLIFNYYVEAIAFCPERCKPWRQDNIVEFSDELDRSVEWNARSLEISAYTQSERSVNSNVLNLPDLDSQASCLNVPNKNATPSNNVCSFSVSLSSRIIKVPARLDL